MEYSQSDTLLMRTLVEMSRPVTMISLYCWTHARGHLRRTSKMAPLIAWLFFSVAEGFSQIDCWSSRKLDWKTNDAKSAVRLKATLAAEGIVRKNAAFQNPPAPVRMRSWIPDGERVLIKAFKY